MYIYQRFHVVGTLGPVPMVLGQHRQPHYTIYSTVLFWQNVATLTYTADYYRVHNAVCVQCIHQLFNRRDQ